MIFDEDERKQFLKEEFGLTPGLEVANRIHDRMVEGLKEIKIALDDEKLKDKVFSIPHRPIDAITLGIIDGKKINIIPTAPSIDKPITRDNLILELEIKTVSDYPNHLFFTDDVHFSPIVATIRQNSLPEDVLDSHLKSDLNFANQLRSEEVKSKFGDTLNLKNLDILKYFKHYTTRMDAESSFMAQIELMINNKGSYNLSQIIKDYANNTLSNDLNNYRRIK